MHVEDKRPRAPVQGMDREETISGKKGREEERSGEKRGEEARHETKRSRRVLFRPKRSAFLLPQPRLNVVLHKSYSITSLSSICICPTGRETIISLSRWRANIKHYLSATRILISSVTVKYISWNDNICLSQAFNSYSNRFSAAFLSLKEDHFLHLRLSVSRRVFLGLTWTFVVLISLRDTWRMLIPV